MKEKKALCICASNMKNSGEEGTSRRVCGLLCEALGRKTVSAEILDLREFALSPCTGCGGCYEGRRCTEDADFNRLYDKMAGADYLFFVSPHYAPVPARLCMLLEKMEQITFLHWWKDTAYRSELCGKLAGIISHGGESHGMGGEQALMSYKAMVNDTIANALDTIQLKVVPFNSRWDTGISLPVKKVTQGKGIFPHQEYDWERIREQVEMYVEILVQTSRTLHAIL